MTEQAQPESELRRLLPLAAIVVVAGILGAPNCGAGNNDSTHHLLGFTYLGGKWSNQHRWQRNPRPHGCCTRQERRNR